MYLQNLLYPSNCMSSASGAYRELLLFIGKKRREQMKKMDTFCLTSTAVPRIVPVSAMVPTGNIPGACQVGF